MRITNGMMINNSLSNLNGALTRVARYNNQLASNRKILTLSDSPVGVLNSLGARNQIRRLEQYQRNVDNSRAWIQQAESSVTEMEELTHTIRELLTDAMGTENADDKKIFATQMRQYTNSLFELCNASNGSQFMFGGYNVTKHPFTAVRDANGNITQVKYNGLDLSGMNASPSSGLEDMGNVSYNPNDGTDPIEIAKGLSWGGKMTAPGSYEVSAEASTTKPGVIEFTFTATLDNGTSKKTGLEDNGAPITISLDLKEVYKKYENSPEDAKNKTETINLEYTDADGNVFSFGSISLQNTDKLDPTNDDHIAALANQIADAVGSDNKNTVVSTSVVNAAATTGSKAPAGMTWTGSITDTTQKYTMSTEIDKDNNTATLSFSNSFGSPYHTVTNKDLKDAIDAGVADGTFDAIDKNGNKVQYNNFKYTLKLEDKGLGTVTITTKDLYDLGLNVGTPGDPATNRANNISTATLAQGIASAEFVASAVGNEANQHIQFEVGHNIMTDVTFTGVELVGTGPDNLFNMMIDLANLLDNNADNGTLTTYITKITQKQDQLLTAVVKSGNRSIKMDTMVQRYKLDAINYEAKRSNIEDIDQAEVIMQMKYSEAIYKQALAASAQIIQPTLMDFLR